MKECWICGIVWRRGCESCKMLLKRFFSTQYEYLVFAAHSVYNICAMIDRFPAWPLFHGSVCTQTRPFRANSPYSSRGYQDNKLASPPAHHAQHGAFLCTRHVYFDEATYWIVFPYERLFYIQKDSARFHSSGRLYLLTVCCMKLRCNHGLCGSDIWNILFRIPCVGWDFL
jgi:hypothetical protein